MTALPGTPEHDALLRAFRAAVDRKIAADIAAEAAAADALRREILPLVRAAVAEVRQTGACQRVWLFGSFAWGEPIAESDIDVLVEGDADEVGYQIGKATRREVHAIALAEAPPSLVERCLADGVSL